MMVRRVAQVNVIEERGVVGLEVRSRPSIHKQTRLEIKQTRAYAFTPKAS